MTIRTGVFWALFSLVQRDHAITMAQVMKKMTTMMMTMPRFLPIPHPSLLKKSQRSSKKYLM